jgi:hypothetical protein
VDGASLDRVGAGVGVEGVDTVPTSTTTVRHPGPTVGDVAPVILAQSTAPRNWPGLKPLLADQTRSRAPVGTTNIRRAIGKSDERNTC